MCTVSGDSGIIPVSLNVPIKKLSVTVLKT